MKKEISVDSLAHTKWDCKYQGELEIRILKQGILVQRVLCRYRREEHESDKRIHSSPIGTGQVE